MKLSYFPALLLAVLTPVVSGQDTLPPPSKFAIALFPGFQALDAFGPLDMLNILSWRTQLNLSVLATTLSPVSTSSHAPPHNASSSFFEEFIIPTHTFDTAPTDIEVLIVPGGLGNRLLGAIPTVEYIRKVYPGLRYLITVCTGAGLAARAGVLDGRRATTNKWAFYETSKLGPKTHWVSQARWVVDGNIWSSSGVSAGIDVTLAWVQSIWGYQTARDLANGAEYDWHQDANWDPFSLRFNLSDVVSGTTLPATPRPTFTSAPPTLGVTTVTATETVIVTACSVTSKTMKTTTTKTSKSSKTTTSTKTTKKAGATHGLYVGYEA